MVAVSLHIQVEQTRLWADVQGNISGTGWVGITREPAPNPMWVVGTVVTVTILEGPGRDQQAQAEIDALGAQLVLRGLTGFRW